MVVKQKIILAGGSGFLGRALGQALVSQGYEVVVLSRRFVSEQAGVRIVFWDGETMGAWCAELKGAHAVINLCGRSVDCRYHAQNRRRILESRLKSTRILALAIKETVDAPKLWLNAASATIYADTRAELPANTEQAGRIGEGFSVTVCQEWEAEFNRWTLPATKQVCLRIAITLGRGGGVVVPLARLARLGLGGSQGSGEQFVSWIHIEDLLRIVSGLLEGRLTGELYNCASPQPLENTAFMHAFRQACGGLGAYFGLAMPKYLLEIGALLIRTETELILKSRKVAPANLLEDGFEFRYPEIEGALAEIF